MVNNLTFCVMLDRGTFHLRSFKNIGVLDDEKFVSGLQQQHSPYPQLIFDQQIISNFHCKKRYYILCSW